MEISRSRMWVRRSFALTLLIVFLASLWVVMHSHLCADVRAAGVVAIILTALSAYWIWLVIGVARKLIEGNTRRPS